MGFNEAQAQAIQHTDGPCLVLAGPGSGKTLTIVNRVKYLIEKQKVRPEEILVVTFTRFAAAEMKSRLCLVMGKRDLPVTVGTFHGIYYGILKWAYRMNQENILSETEKYQILRGVINKERMEIFDEEDFIQDIAAEIGKVKNNRIPLEEFVSEKCSADAFRNIYRNYEQHRKELKKIDFDDMLVLCYELFQSRPDVLAQWQKKFRYVLIDEFQDINPVQYDLLRVWNKNGQELFVIGDPDQSVYGFRGSDSQCFTRMEKDYPMLRTIRLTDNYRSTPEIVACALDVISHNKGPERSMQASNPAGAAVRVVEAPGEMGEAIFIAKEVNRLIGGIDMLDVEENHGGEVKRVRSFSDIAVLYRTHRQAQLLEKCLRQEGIPYVVAGREDFLLDKNVRGTLYFFQYLLCPEDLVSRSFCRKLIWPAEEALAEEQLSMLAAKYGKKVRREKTEKLLEAWIKDRKLEESEAMSRLLNAAVLNPSMESFLETISFGSEGDVRRCGSRKFPADAVMLMTLHGAKGLEFPAVFLYGMRKGLMPLELGTAAGDMEEERRLFYVGMTRAAEELIITSSGEPSVFLGEIPEEHAVMEKAKKEKPVEEVIQLSLFDMEWT